MPRSGKDELWATGCRMYGQLDFSNTTYWNSEYRAKPELENLTRFEKVLECERIKGVRTGGFGVIVKHNKNWQRAGWQEPYLGVFEVSSIGLGARHGSKNHQRWASFENLWFHHQGMEFGKEDAAIDGRDRMIDAGGYQSTIVNTPNKQFPFDFIGEPKLEFPGKVDQIVAGTTHFAALINGAVYTWGDSRYTAPLGRSVSASAPADAPSLVEALEDLEGNERILKIAASGYITAVIREGGDCYVWGMTEPGSKEGAAQILGLSSTPEPIDLDVQKVVDVAVGREMIVVLVEAEEGQERRRLWVKGRSTKGELGLGDVEQVGEWTEIDVGLPDEMEIQGIFAGAETVLLHVVPGSRCR